jgi:hypothetical protein
MNSNQEQSGGEESIALQYIYIYYFLPDNNTFVSIGAYLRTCLLTIVTKNYYSWFRMMATVLALTLTLTLILLRSSLSSSSLSTSNEITITSTTSIVDSNKEDNYIDIFEMEQQPSNEEGQQQQQQMIFKKKNSPLRQRRSVLVLVIYYYYF